MDRAKILDTAKKMVCGHREQDYGSPENNFQVIAGLWNRYLGNRLTKPLTAFDVAMMMTLFKIGRITSGTCTDDSIVDACGYLACAGEIKQEMTAWQENLKKTLALDELKCFTDRRPDPETK